MKNAEEQREVLAKVIDDLLNGDILPQTAKEVSNAACKQIASVKVQLQYRAMRKEKPEIKFLDCN